MSGVLFISPHSEDGSRLSQMLGSLPFVFKHVERPGHARRDLESCRFSVILTEATLADGNWTDVLDLARDVLPGAEVIVTDRFADGRLWSEVLNRGAYDLLAQPFEAPEVRRILSNACSRWIPEEHAHAAV